MNSMNPKFNLHQARSPELAVGLVLLFVVLIVTLYKITRR
jgi:hypothetical protein